MKSMSAFAVQQGDLHKALGIPCQDYVSECHNPYVSAVALCDGAGSCANSEKAAEAFSATVAEILTLAFDRLYLYAERRDASMLAKVFLECLHRENGLRDYWNDDALTTLLFAAIHKDGRWLAGHVGDGAILFHNALGTQVLSPPENGFSSSETYFINEAEELSLAHLRFYHNRSHGFISFLLTSDGCEGSLLEEMKQPSTIAVKLFQHWSSNKANAFQQYLTGALIRYFSQHSDDDLSIALLGNEPENNNMRL